MPTALWLLSAFSDEHPAHTKQTHRRWLRDADCVNVDVIQDNRDRLCSPKHEADLFNIRIRQDFDTEFSIALSWKNLIHERNISWGRWYRDVNRINHIIAEIDPNLFVLVEIRIVRNFQVNGNICGADKLRLSRSPHRESYRKKHTFMVVDDEQAIRDLLLNRIQRRGHVAFCVASCKEAVEEFRLFADTVTVALVDVGLRDATGYECARQLRMINEDVCIILMSGSDSDLRTMPDLRAAFIKKPFSVEHIEQMVADAELYSKINK